MEPGALGKEYGDSDVVCRQGERGDCMFIVQSGQLEVVHEENGNSVVVGQLKAGDVFGEMSIIDRKPRSATVRAKGKTRVLTLDKRAFLRRVHEDPTLAFRVMEKMSQRIRSLDEELARAQPR
jgi:CRP/FNR family transcriptional regulator, cyclic AMP receptor protein